MDAHTRNKKQAQEDVCIVILQYLWAQFRDEESPCSSAQHTHVDSDGLLKKFVAEINHAISKKKIISHCGSCPIETCCLTFMRWVRGGPQPRTPPTWSPSS